MASAESSKLLALSALYSLYKRAKGAGGPLPPAAEGLHPPGPEPDYNESFYFNFIDPGSGIGGYTRIGLLPNRDADIGAMMIFAGGRRLLAGYESGRASVSPGRLEMGRLRFEKLEPLRRWRLTWEGEMLDLEDSRMLPGVVEGVEGVRTPVSVDITFEGMAPCFNFKDADPRAIAEMLVAAGTKWKDLGKVSRVSTEHYEQAGRWTGTVAFGGEAREFVGGGHRDHSWGVRDWSAPRLWTWLTCQFEDGLAFNLSRVAIESVDVFNGFICRGGANYPLRRASLKTEFEADGVTQKGLSFTMEDTGGRVIDVEASVRAVIPLDLRSRGHDTLINEGLAEYRREGMTSLGIAEYLHQMGGSRGSPTGSTTCRSV